MADRTVLLMRHGKSDYPGGVTDHDRPLAPRGVRQAADTGHWITATYGAVDQILSSSAVRATQTAQATGIDAPLESADEIYDASPREILDAIRSTSDTVSTLLVVGHAPGIPALAVRLAGAGSSDDAVDAVHESFPTCAVAVLAVPGSWSDLEFEQAQLVSARIDRG